MSKRIKIFAERPNTGRIYAIVPWGLYFNKDIWKAKTGDVIVFCEGWRQDKMILTRRSKLSTKTPAFDFLLKSIYGEHMSAGKFFDRWSGVARQQNCGKHAFHREEVAIIEVRPYSEEAEEIIDEIEELNERKQRLEQTIREIHKGIYSHPDIL